MIFICFTTVLLPDSPAPGNDKREKERRQNMVRVFGAAGGNERVRKQNITQTDMRDGLLM